MKKIWLKMPNASTINNLEYVIIPFSVSLLYKSFTYWLPWGAGIRFYGYVSKERL